MKRCVSFFVLMMHVFFLNAQPAISPDAHALEQLQQNGLWHLGSPLRLHLGCGESHLNGYINIDFPPSEHTVQQRVAADIFADITTLYFPAQTVDEVRNHHMFEHFNRGTALGLLCVWHHMLKVGGTVHIETPDFEESIKLLLQPTYSYQQKQLIIRHIFGSHEAFWATHYDGWYKEKFIRVLEALGFELQLVTPSHWLVLHNITVHARKKEHFSLNELAQRAKGLLKDSMVDNSPTENKIWSIWCNDIDTQIKKASR